MKISNFKIMLLLVLGAFTLTLPNYACAEEKNLSAESQRWLDENLANGKIRGGTAADINNKIAALEAQYKPLKDKYWNAKKRFTQAVIQWELDDLIKRKTEQKVIEEFKREWAEADGFWASGWAAVKGAFKLINKRNIRIMSMGWEYIEAAFTSDKGDSAEDALNEIRENYDGDPKLIAIAKEMMEVGKQAYEVQLQKETYAEITGGELYIYTEIYKDANGKEVKKEVFFQKNGDTFVTVGGVAVGCIPLPVKLAELKNCIFCPLFKTIFNASQVVSTNAFKHLGKSMAQVMLIGYALFVAFSVLKLVSAFTKQDGPKFITGLISQTFKVLFAYILLMKSGEIYAYVIAPVLSAGLEFGMSLLFEKGNTYINGCRGFSGGAVDGIIPQYLYTKLDCFIRAVQAEISIPQSIGSTLMCVARNASADKIFIVKIWDFSMMFQGLIIFGFAWLISLAFAFYLIDATVRLGIVGALMPFLIACWPFKVTSSYTSKGWEMFMNSFFTFVMMGLVVSINVQLMGQALTGSQGGFKAIEMAVNGDKVSELRELLDIGFSGFLILIACCLFGFKLTGQATELAGTMAGGGGSAIGSQIGGLAASGAKAVAGTAVNTGKKATSFVGNVTGATAGLNKMKDSAINGAARTAAKMFGVGRSSGAAGGGSKPSTPKQSDSTQAQNNQPVSGTTPPPSAQQTQKAQEAAPRNSGNGSDSPAMKQDVQNSMREADRNTHNYVGNKQDNNTAWDKYQKSEESLKQSKNEYENAQRMANNAKGTPDEAKHTAAAEKAAAKYAGVQKAHSQNEQNVQDTQDKMNNSAINAYVNQQKAIAQRNGKSFDENASKDYAKNHLDEIKKNLDTIIKADPKYN